MSMKLWFWYFIQMLYLVLLSCFFISLTHCLVAKPLCLSSERSALLEFKGSFVSYPYCSVDSSKLASWMIEGGRDNCCSWDGVECSNDTGHVIGLHLDDSCLYGSIDSNSTLFQLLHLQTLDLSGNNFNYSHIPSSIGQLSDLRYLNLYDSKFVGQIPSTMSRLSNLSFLDLSDNFALSGDLRNLVSNLTRLETLRLNSINISSTVPDIFANFTSLKFLYLSECGLRGRFPERIFQLPNLQSLHIPSNPDLYGNLPDFNFSSPLEVLNLHRTGFYGELPSSIENLNSLTSLTLSKCKFSGIIPLTLGNLTKLQELDLFENKFSGKIPSSLEHLTQLESLSLANNNFRDATLSWVGKQNKLIELDLSHINLSGILLPSLGNLTKLIVLRLNDNQLSGQVPSWLRNFTQLTDLYLNANKLKGSIPSSFSQLTSILVITLENNNLSGPVDFNIFMKIKDLAYLNLAGNKLTVLTDHITPNTTVPKFKSLGLGSCSLTQFPAFLKHQDQIVFLDLGENNIEGQIPKWMWNMSRESLTLLNLGYNALTGVEEPRDAFPWFNLRLLDLSNNRFQEPFTFLPAICNLSLLVALDLSCNSMSGMLPQCIGNFSSLELLNLRQNMFYGSIPNTFNNGSKLKFIDFSQNQLQGRVPRSLVNCETLQAVDLSHNQLMDAFPYWFGRLPMLGLLMLRSNHFHGKIEEPVTNYEFPLLHIIDLSDNNFSGNLPVKYIMNWKAMKVLNRSASTYKRLIFAGIFFSTTITMKGIERNYSKINDALTSIDLSNNKFEGEIPDSIGNLKGLMSLNLSSNILNGSIPSSLGNMDHLESLDLSHNKLSGEIPQHFSQLTFLEIFDVSHNNLSGRIPQGNQLDSFANSSYEGNVELCGKPLSKKCGDFEEQTSSISRENQDQESVLQFGWKAVVIGYGCGVIVGVVLGNYILTRNQEWFLRTFRLQRPKKRSNRKGG